MNLVEYAVDGAVATITLNRPPVNALNAHLIADIGEAIRQAEDPAIRAIVITGQPSFAAGADISGFRASFEGKAEERQSSGLRDVAARLDALPKPSIAAVFGYALGGGLELAMSADFRYLAEDAKVGQPEILAGRGTESDLHYLEDLGRTIKATSRCGLGKTACNPVLTTIANFRSLYNAIQKAPDDSHKASFDIYRALRDHEVLAGRPSELYPHET